MGWENYIRVIGLGAALMGNGCGPPESHPKNNLSVEKETVFTTPDGLADFLDGEDIYVVSNKREFLSGVEVTSYSVFREGNYQGNIYLAETGEGEGDFLVSSASGRRPGMRRDGGLPPKLVIRPLEGVTLFDHEQEVMYDLTRWTLDGEYTCRGILTSEELVQERKSAIDWIGRFEPTGLVSWFYDAVDWLMGRGVLDDIPPGKQWYSITAENPTGKPIDLQRDLIEAKFGRETYEKLEDACGGQNPNTMENPPSDLEELLALCRDYYQKFERDCSANPASQQIVEEYISEVCQEKNYDALRENRANLECALEDTCDEFWTCLKL